MTGNIRFGLVLDQTKRQTLARVGEPEGGDYHGPLLCGVSSVGLGASARIGGSAQRVQRRSLQGFCRRQRGLVLDQHVSMTYANRVLVPPKGGTKYPNIPPSPRGITGHFLSLPARGGAEARLSLN